MQWLPGHELTNRPYRIEKELGQGGFGITYKAIDLTLDIPVVIKTPNNKLQKDNNYQKYVTNFTREAKQLAQLGLNPHPHIVRVSSLFQEDNLPCIVMDFVPGQSLYDLVWSQGKLSEAQAVEYIKQIGSALVVCHKAGIVHRDVHPNNILIHDDNGKAILIDFGISGSTQTSRNTHSGNRAFAPWEQVAYWEGENSKTPQVDIYTLAASLYFLVTGQEPTECLARKYNNSELIEPKQLNSDLSDEINQAILKGVEVVPEKRPNSMQKWLELLNFCSYKIEEKLFTVESSVTIANIAGKDKYIRSDFKISNSINDLEKESTDLEKSNSNLCVDKTKFRHSKSAKLKQKLEYVKYIAAGFGVFGLIFASFYVKNRSFQVKINQPLLQDKRASDTQTNSVKTAKLSEPELITTLTDRSLFRCSECFSPNGKIIASGGSDNTIKLWNVETQQEIATLIGHSRSIYSVAFSPDGKTLASGGRDNTIKLWNVEAQREIATLTGHSDLIRSVVFSPDGRTLASGSEDDTIKLWDVKTQQEIATLTGRNDVYSVAFSPDGKILASGIGLKIELWDVKTQQKIADLTGHPRTIYSVAFSPNGKILASSSGEGTIKLWDVETQQETSTFTGHSSYVYSVAFSPDGKILASGGVDKNIKLWDVETQREIITLNGHSNGVSPVAFSPDGITLVSGELGKTIKLWRIPPYLSLEKGLIPLSTYKE